jgi:hypothetical protein
MERTQLSDRYSHPVIHRGRDKSGHEKRNVRNHWDGIGDKEQRLTTN